MVEVYRTNVGNKEQADFLLEQLHTQFKDCKINFDLDDCDNILRVECYKENIDVEGIILFIKDFNFTAEVLSDEQAKTQSKPILSQFRIL